MPLFPALPYKGTIFFEWEELLFRQLCLIIPGLFRPWKYIRSMICQDYVLLGENSYK